MGTFKLVSYSQIVMWVLAAAILLGVAACDGPDPGPDQCVGARCEDSGSDGDPRLEGGLDRSAIDALGDLSADGADDPSAPLAGGFGDPCESDDDCASRYCIDSDEGWVCTALCSGNGDCPAGFECVFLVDSGADAVRICVPERDVLCESCERDTDCFGFGAYCLEQDDGTFCATNCTSDPCPEHYLCNPIEIAGAGPDGEALHTELCEPEWGVCSGCVDGDGDGFGDGWACAGADCDDDAEGVNPDSPERCNGLDDDCDEAVDEDFDTANDVNHCGGCDIVCAFDHAAPVCRDGRCSFTECDEGFGDCDDVPDNGCETDFSSALNCGTCSPLDGVPGEACGTCDTGIWACDGLGVLFCAGDGGPDLLNACGGCATLESPVGSPCGPCGLDVYACLGTEQTECSGETRANDCEGCTELTRPPGSTCGPCGLDRYVCDGAEATVCDGATTANACGGCAELGGVPGTSCGACDSGEWACSLDDETLYCAGESPTNACGGCTTLDVVPGVPCGRCGLDSYVCDGTDDTVCPGDTFVNSCGGCAPLPNEPGEACGGCGLDEYVCVAGDPELIACDGDTRVNACGGCGILEYDPETPCGVCGGGVWTCDEAGALACVGDVGVLGNGSTASCAGRDCLEILEAGLSTGDGDYWIDPAGGGEAASFQVYCDMTTDGGGWTRIYLAESTNLNSGTAGIPYDVTDPSLLEDATEALLAFVDEADGMSVSGDYATIEFPSAWVSASPMQYSTGSSIVSTAVNGEWVGTKTIYYGTCDFATPCADNWGGCSSDWLHGRICINDTTAPYWGMWSGPTLTHEDWCTDSAITTSASLCTSTSLLFSLAVRSRTNDGDGDGVAVWEDCDDSDPEIYPFGGDAYGDAVDSDCDGMDCEAGYLDGVYFAACAIEADQPGAAAACLNGGYDGLASILSADEQVAIEGLFGAAGFTADGHWMGLTDGAVEGVWVWSDGSPLDYVNWHPSEPDPAEEDCAAISWVTYGGQWFDAPCESLREGLVCSSR